MNDFYFHRALPVMRRNPLLTALVVYSAGICMAASIAAVAVWRGTSTCPIARQSEHPYMVRTGSPARKIIPTRVMI
jgi:hypothetical protein